MHAIIREFFAAGGQLSQSLSAYEARPGQLTVALAIADALQSQTSLVAEAGTGIGKSLAYLVPALLSGLRIVVSTGTKNLQDQLLQKDLPLVQRALGKNFSVEVMKGRANYLCEKRAEQVFQRQPLPHVAYCEELQALRSWRQETQTGDRTEISTLSDDAPIWREVSATTEQCLGRACCHFERCWVTQMRRRAQTASLVIVNHHLYLADAALRQRGDEPIALLPAHDAVIFDEAHELDEVAAQHFGYQVSEHRLHELSLDIAASIAGQGRIAKLLQPSLAALPRHARHLFDLLPFQPGRRRFDPSELSSAAAQALGEVDGLLQRLQAELAEATFEEGKALARRVASVATELAFILQASQAPSETTQTMPPYVRFSEATGRQRAVVARPVEIAPILGPMLDQIPSVFISATLRIRRSFAHFQRRMGLGTVAEVCVDSPFSYSTQACIYVPTDLPEPDHAAFSQVAASRVATLIEASGGGAFVLCTSHRVLPLMRDALANFRLGPVLMQGEGSKNHLVTTFCQHRNAVLLATMSFWKGVDVPGPALRLVIIDKLPFASPSDPVIEAKIAHLKTNGLDAFTSYQMPHAGLLLRQGFGRLIRRQTDTGMVAILDCRLRTRRYGPLLMQSLPSCRKITDLAEAVAFLQDGAKTDGGQNVGE